MAKWTLAPINAKCGFCGTPIAEKTPILKAGPSQNLIRCQTCGEKYLPYDPEAIEKAAELAEERAAIQWEGQPHFSRPSPSVASPEPGFTPLARIADLFDAKRRQAKDD